MASVHAAHLHYASLRAWAIPCTGVLAMGNHYNADAIQRDIRIGYLRKLDQKQHKFITYVYKNWNGQYIRHRRAWVILEALVDHANRIQDNLKKSEKLDA